MLPLTTTHQFLSDKNVIGAGEYCLGLTDAGFLGYVSQDGVVTLGNPVARDIPRFLTLQTTLLGHGTNTPLIYRTLEPYALEELERLKQAYAAKHGEIPSTGHLFLSHWVRYEMPESIYERIAGQDRQDPVLSITSSRYTDRIQLNELRLTNPQSAFILGMMLRPNFASMVITEERVRIKRSDLATAQTNYGLWILDPDLMASISGYPKYYRISQGTTDFRNKTFHHTADLERMLDKE